MFKKMAILFVVILFAIACEESGVTSNKTQVKFSTQKEVVSVQDFYENGDLKVKEQLVNGQKEGA